jgi:hypothetical protein
MSVSVDKAWESDFARCIDLDISWALNRFPNLFDFAFANQDRCVVQNIAFFVLRYDPIAVLDQQ